MIFTRGINTKPPIFSGKAREEAKLDSGLLHSCSIAEYSTIKMVPQSFISICSYELRDIE